MLERGRGDDWEGREEEEGIGDRSEEREEDGKERNGTEQEEIGRGRWEEE